MPKINIDFTKGLVQETGSGFGINSSVTIADDAALDATTFLTKVAGAHEVTLPASAETGAIKVLAMTAAAAGVIKAANAVTEGGADITFGEIGDGAVCIYNGTAWVVLVTNG